MKKSFWPIFLLLSSVKNLKGQFILVQKPVWQLPWETWDRFFRTWEIVENTFFWKKGKLSSEEKFLPFLPPIMECDKPQGTVSCSSEASLTSTVEKLRSFLQDLRGCWKHNFLKKKQYLQWGKIYGPIFRVLSSVAHLKGQFVGVFNIFHHYYVSYKINTLGPRRLLKTQYFERKANFPVKKSFWPNLPPIIECDKPQGTVYISSEASVTITLGNLRSFLQDLRVCWKQNFLKKKLPLQWGKIYGPLFRVLSSVAHLKR